MMYDHEKSDSAIVAVKPTNKAGQPAAELVEPRAGAGTKLTSPWPQRHPMLREKRTSNLRCLRSVFDDHGHQRGLPVPCASRVTRHGPA
jgi:hypothetical protein